MKASELIVKACIIVQTNKLVLNIVNLSKIVTIDLTDVELPDGWVMFEIGENEYDVNLFLDGDTNEFSLSIYNVIDGSTDTLNDALEPVKDFKVIGDMNKILINLGYIETLS